MPADSKSKHHHRSSRLGQFVAGSNSADRLRQHMARTGRTLSGQRLWTDTEIKLLCRFYPDYRRACAALPGRSFDAIRSKALRMGITRPLRIWLDEDLKSLKGPYRQGMPIDDIRTLLPGKTARQIWHRAAHSGWRRPRKPPKSTGLKPDDIIRNRNFALKYTLRDLDEYTDGDGYFLRRPSRTNWKKISRAVDTLEGRMSIIWSLNE